jgi:hypothetical protein
MPNENCICGKPLVDCFTPNLCDRLNLTVAVGNFTIQEEAIVYFCVCGEVTLKRTRSDVSYHRTVERTFENPRKNWETTENIEMGWKEG